MHNRLHKTAQPGGTGGTQTVSPSTPPYIHGSQSPSGVHVSTPKMRAASRASHGLGTLTNAINVYGNLTNKSETPQGIVHNDPQYVQAAMNTGFGLMEANNLRKTFRPPSTAIQAAGRSGGSYIAPALGSIGAVSRLIDKDYPGAAIDAVSTAAPILGGMYGGPLGETVGTGVSWLGQGVNAVRDIMNNRNQMQLPSQKKSYQGTLGQTTPGQTTPGQTTPGQTTPPPVYNSSQQATSKIASAMSTYNHNFKSKKAFASGFVKAALAKGLSIEEFSHLTKKALSPGTSLNYDDMAAIKAQLAEDNADVDIYSDPSGEAMRNYRARLLALRDEASNEIPAVAASLSGLRSGALGALAGAGTGSAIGAIAKHSPILNLPHSHKQYLPTLGAIGGASLGSIVAAIPAAKKKYETVKALQKLHNPHNLQALRELGEDDKNILNQ
jgi:hypothetical protein